MKTNTNARVRRAAEHLDAVHRGDGHWVYYDEETDRWYSVTAAELAELCVYLDDDDPAISASAYSHWCEGGEAEEMPRGWVPGFDCEEPS